MIQRIQSIYLFVAALLSVFTVWCPLARYAVEANTANGFYILTSFGLDTYGIEPVAGSTFIPWGILVFSLLSTMFPLIAIFQYKNRKRQIAFCKWALAAIVLFYASYAAYAYSYMQDLVSTTFSVSWVAVLPVLSLVAVILAIRGIKKDEELIKAADRIR